MHDKWCFRIENIYQVKPNERKKRVEKKKAFDTEKRSRSRKIMRKETNEEARKKTNRGKSKSKLRKISISFVIFWISSSWCVCPSPFHSFRWRRSMGLAFWWANELELSWVFSRYYASTTLITVNNCSLVQSFRSEDRRNSITGLAIHRASQLSGIIQCVSVAINGS